MKAITAKTCNGQMNTRERQIIESGGAEKWRWKWGRSLLVMVVDLSFSQRFKLVLVLPPALSGAEGAWQNHTSPTPIAAPDLSLESLCLREYTSEYPDLPYSRGHSESCGRLDDGEEYHVHPLSLQQVRRPHHKTNCVHLSIPYERADSRDLVFGSWKDEAPRAPTPTTLVSSGVP